MDVQTNRISGAEALIRWNHPTRGLISPNNFIPLAEEVGLIADIGNYVLQGACREAVRWRVPTLDQQVAVVAGAG